MTDKNMISLRWLAVARLQQAILQIVKSQDHLDPQLWFNTPCGNYHLAIEIPEEAAERSLLFRRLQMLFGYLEADQVALAAELASPDCVAVVAASNCAMCCCTALIERWTTPWTVANFAQTQWQPAVSIGPEIQALLPGQPCVVDKLDRSALNAWFGPQGRFPAQHLPTGTVHPF